VDTRKKLDPRRSGWSLELGRRLPKKKLQPDSNGDAVRISGAHEVLTRTGSGDIFGGNQIWM